MKTGVTLAMTMVSADGLNRWYEKLPPCDRRGAAFEIADAIEGLLGISVDVAEGTDTDWPVAHARLTACVEGALTGGPLPGERERLVEMIGHLVSRGGPPVGRLVSDVAEILFLEREERTEYRLNRLPVAPYVISKLLLEYALKAQRLDRLMGTLNKRFCADRCPKPPVGCCHLLGYDLGLVPDRMLVLQRLEARYNGWAEPEHPDLRKCRYHTETGCALRLFKSPACLGAMCAALEADLDTRYTASGLIRLRSALEGFRNCDIDRFEVFRAMDRLIAVGKVLEDAD